MATTLAPFEEYARWRGLLAGERLPSAIVDLDAMEANLARVLAPLDGTPLGLRIATKSVRCTALLRHVVDKAGDRIRGFMTWSAHETAMLAELGFNDFVLGYPVSRRDEAEAVAKVVREGRYAAVVVDDPVHIALLAEAARAADVEIPVLIEVDVGLRALGQVFGVRRSPLQLVDAVRDLAGLVRDTPGVRLDGVMAYEAQVAGLRDRDPFHRARGPLVRLIKARSIALAADRRRAVVQALQDDGHILRIVNGGGTGSLRSSAQDTALTEVTAGSGLLGPHLFDGYDGLALEPAAWFALSVARAPSPDIVTCAGGGYAASGPPGADRAPIAVLPEGLRPLPTEGFGEVQTPFLVTRPDQRPSIGDPVLCRHAKAGEVMERFDEVLLVRKAGVLTRVPTYRGLGGAFG
jgi:D-serine deaminase-like pyridoxal phosphate-dependent protein